MPYMGNTTRKASDIRRFDVTGSTSATHTLTWTAPNEQSLIVTVNGVKQHEDAYSVSGTTLSLTSALISTDKLEVIGINDIGTTITPAQNSVDTDKILDDAVTADKLANSINTEIAANTAKVTNATHTGDVTGATALTIASGAVDIAMLSATGVASATTFLRGDNAWASAGGTNTPAFLAKFASSGSQTFSDNTTAKVEMSQEIYDSDSAYDPVTNYRWTPGVVGKYLIGFSVYTEDNEIVRASGYLYMNGSQIFKNHQKVQLVDQTAVASPRHTYNGQSIVDVTATTDYFEVYCWIDTSDGGTAVVADQVMTYFWGHRLLT